MEGGSKFNIDLESPLDVSSSDMIVPVQQATFQHNWQKFQGKCLPNSLRFEMNGWAAGWNIYNFDYNHDRIQINDKYASSVRVNLNPTYMARLFNSKSGDDIYAEKLFTPVSSPITDGVSVEDDIIKGELSDGTAFSIAWDPATKVATSLDGFNVTYKQNKNYTWSFKVEDTSKVYNVDNTIRMPGSLTGTGIDNTIKYTGASKDSNGHLIHNWDSFEFDETSKEFYIPGISAPFILTADDIENNHIKLDNITADSSDTLAISYTTDTYYNEFNKCSIVPVTGDYMTIATDASTKNIFNFYKAKLSSNSLTAGGHIDMDIRVPIWFSAYVKVENDVDNHVIYPDNVDGIYFTLPSAKCSIRLDSVFDDSPIINTYTGNVGDIVTLKPEGHRYCKISLGNTIEPSDSFNITEGELGTDTTCFITDDNSGVGVYIGSMERFSDIAGYWRSTSNKLTIDYFSASADLQNFISDGTFDFRSEGSGDDWTVTSSGTKVQIQRKYSPYMLAKYILGNNYIEPGNPIFKVADNFAINNWVNWDDENNAVYTKENLSDIAGVRYIPENSTDSDEITYPEGIDSDESYINSKLNSIYRSAFMHLKEGVSINDRATTSTPISNANINSVFTPVRTGIKLSSQGFIVTDTTTGVSTSQTVHYELCVGMYNRNTYIKPEDIKTVTGYTGDINTGFTVDSEDEVFMPFEYVPFVDSLYYTDNDQSITHEGVIAVLAWKLVDDSTDTFVESGFDIGYNITGEYKDKLFFISTENRTLQELAIILFGKYYSDIEITKSTVFTPTYTSDSDGNTVSTKSLTRKVIKYSSSCFDFDIDDINSTTDKREAFDTLWEEWYPDIQNPADLSTTTATEDSTYLYYSDIEVEQSDTAVSFTVLVPPCMKVGSKFEDSEYLKERAYYVKCFNSLGVEPRISNVTTEGGVYENHIDVSKYYDLTVENGTGSIKFCPDNEDSSFYLDCDLNGYYGMSAKYDTYGNTQDDTTSLTSVDQYYHYTTGLSYSFVKWTGHDDSYAQYSGIATVTILDYWNDTGLVAAYDVTKTTTIMVSSTAETTIKARFADKFKSFYATYEEQLSNFTSGVFFICDRPKDDSSLQRTTWYKAPVKVEAGSLSIYGTSKSNTNNWFDEIGIALSSDVVNEYVDVVENGQTVRYRNKVNGTFERISSAYITHNDDGIVYALPLWGHICKRFTYTEKSSASDIANNTDSILPVTQLEDTSALLTSTSKDYIFIDRSTGDANLNRRWFDLELVSITPDEMVTFRIKAISDGQLFYAPKQSAIDTVTSSDEAIATETTSTTYYPSIIDYNGNMKSVNSNMCNFNFKWVPDAFYMPLSVSFDLSTSLSDKTHKFYANLSQVLKGIECTIGSIDDITDDLLPLTVEFDGDSDKVLVLHFDTTRDGTRTVLQNNTEINLDSFDAILSFNADTTLDNELSVVVTRNFSIDAEFASSDADTDELVTWQNDRFTIEHTEDVDTDGIADICTYTYDAVLKKLVGRSTSVTVETNTDGSEKISFTDYYATLNFSAILRDTPDDYVVFNDDYKIKYKELLSLDNDIYVQSTDIRSPNTVKEIGKLDISNYQFVKQAWNTTTEVENYWWVDSTHILELTADKFILKRKTDELTDWDGDRFENIFEVPRHEIIGELTPIYTVTNMYNTLDRSGLLLVMYANEEFEVNCDIYNIVTAINKIGTISFDLKHKEIGQVLNDVKYSGTHAYFNTYSQATAKQLLSQAKWTNTVIDNKLIIGCHLSNNFDQWAAVFNLDSFICTECIQGYGFVGLNGSLTGGMLPTEYFSTSVGGFNSTVEDISVLDISTDTDDADSAYLIDSLTELNQLESHVVGTAEKQWYIQKELYGIVSHLTYSNGTFSVNVLPMTNKYDSIYKSPSFSTYIIGDNMVQRMSFDDLFNFTGNAGTVWSLICKLCGYPYLFTFSPRISTFTYLQQTLGQYAYVHHNSSETDSPLDVKNTAGDNKMGTMTEDGTEYDRKTLAPILSDELTFGKQIIEQSTLNTAPYDKFITLIFAMFAPPLAHIDRNLVVNSEVNQTAVSDFGKKYSQFAMENLANLGPKALLTESNEQSVVSRIAGIKSLDMFYSTSEKQHIYAGPGFVEHQFMADCIAQSVTDVAAEGQVRQLTLILKSLTSFQGMLILKLEDVIIKGLLDTANCLKELTACTNNFGAVIAAAIVAVAKGMSYAKEPTKLAYNTIDKLLDVMTQRGVTCEDTGRISRYTMTPEGKHKYGEKNETFLWPCLGVPTDGLSYNDETVDACIKKSTWQLNLQASKAYTQDNLIKKFTSHYNDLYTGSKINFSSATQGKKTNKSTFNNYGDIDYYTASCFGKNTKRTLPADMACIQGVESFLPVQPFKNENISCGAPVFAPSLFHDYIIDRSWDLTQCCTYGLQQWVTVKDTKVTNCPPSNMIVNDEFCGIAVSYSAIEVKRGLSKSYMRPWAITPNALALNCTGYNSIFNDRLYHAFDGVSYRLVEWKGSSAMNKNFQTFLYGFQVNDRFKRGNKFPANELLGNFESEPTQYIDTIDKFWTQVNVAAKEKGMQGGTVGEDKDATRWALPIFTEPVTTLPAAVKTLTAMTLNVYDGVTGLVTNIMNNQSAYKAPLSIDFTIGKNVYRQTEEYISSVETIEGIDIVTDIIPSLGLKFLGSTPTEAYFYSKATRCYYIFSGTTLIKMDMMERFRDIQRGFWDFVNQEVVMPCLMTFKRLNPEVSDKDSETDNIIVPLISKGQVTGEVIPPLTTIFNDRSWYKCVSLPIGFAYQGPNRVIINSNVFVEYMLESLKDNLGKWKRLDREKYTNKREYQEEYTDVVTTVNGVKGWTYNPFLLVTSALGLDESNDCIFEWDITFCWPVEMDLIYGNDNYACVNIMAETMTPGGKQTSRPTHVFLTKELFTRSGNYGYYSFRFQSKNGSGNRERLHIWSDQYIAISKLVCEIKSITQRRSEQLTQQQDVMKLKEL
jgi:hypothetical protein